MVATATALEYNATLRVSDTEVDLLSGRYYYCAYVENLSVIPTGVNIVQRTAIAFAYSMLLNEGFLYGLSRAGVLLRGPEPRGPRSGRRVGPR